MRALILQAINALRRNSGLATRDYRYGGREGSPAAARKSRCGNGDAAAAITKAAAAIEMPQRQLQSRSGNGDAAAAIAKPKRQLQSRSGNPNAAAATEKPLRQFTIFHVTPIIITACEPTKDF